MKKIFLFFIALISFCFVQAQTIDSIDSLDIALDIINIKPNDVSFLREVEAKLANNSDALIYYKDVEFRMAGQYGNILVITYLDSQIRIEVGKFLQFLTKWDRLCETK